MNCISGHGLIGGGLEDMLNLNFACMIHLILCSSLTTAIWVLLFVTHTHTQFVAFKLMSH